MALWNKTGNAKAEKRNDFLKDLSMHGQELVYRIKETVGGTWDNVTETMTDGSEVNTDTPYGRAILIVPMKSLDDGESTNKMVVAGGRKIEAVDVTVTVLGRMHTKVPLNMNALYVVGGQTYKLSRIVNNVMIGTLHCWNEVLLEKA